MPEARLHEHPRPGTDEYDEPVREEIAHYGRPSESETARDTLMQPAPTAWTEMEIRAAALIRDATGDDVNGHLLNRVRDKPGRRMLSLGSGPGGLEVEIARLAPSAEIVCMGANAELLQLGREGAEAAGLKMQFIETDLNSTRLPPAAFDLVFCHAALHQIIELESLADQIKQTLRPDGVMITVDVVTRNGYQMWPETREIVRTLFKTLPMRFRLNHTAYDAPLIDDDIWEVDTSLGGMECARSEDILPIINQRFAARSYVPYFGLSRRFFDTMYGPNYNLADPLDSALFNWIWQLDTHYLATRRLRPETFFGIYGAE